MDLRKLKKLIDLVKESGITALELTEGEEKVSINNSGAGNALGAAAPSAAASAIPIAAASEAVAQKIEPADGHVVKSPMVG
ncbi:MAG TPA: acetyl-CoA carboxylase biotin carboxyl carrier protein, partial [Betaproteobacteria bacterium]|nr:acetyl-CoA carboxylase biotin carboxyl carrier protein [Betaproteobacteria bacterium]